MSFNHSLSVPLQTTSDKVLFLDIDRFHFKSIGSDSDILQRAFERCKAGCSTITVCSLHSNAADAHMVTWSLSG